ncbi:hypothetical protein PENTCL1PPCAC_26577, partial [Pristionchus entomophagus]
MFVFSVEVAVMSIIISVIMRPALSYLFDSYSCRSNSVATGYLACERSGRGTIESMENMEGQKDLSPMGPDTVMKTLAADSTEPKKAKNPTAVEDDGNYENLHAQDEQELKKVLKSMEKSE